jgi:TolB-like protein/Flp pilus assembly protein TadD
MNSGHFFLELKRRNVYKVAVAYAVIAWLLVQAGSILFPTFEAPPWVMKVFVAVIAAAFPFSLIMSWAFELTPEGARRIPKRSRREQTPGWSGAKFAVVSTSLALLSLGFFIFPFLKSNSVATKGPGPAPALPVSPKSLAVLPFQNMSEEKENAYFADGVQEEILTALARVADLKVISRTSVMQFRELEKRNLRQIAQQLGVAHVLEGSVQRAANRVRVTAQLIDTRSDTHVWAERYDGELADVFGIQTEIAQKIAQQLEAALSSKEKATIKTAPTTDIVAYDLYLRAKEIWLRGAPRRAAQTEEQVQLLDQAVARDPAFVSAFCLLARAHLNSYWFYHDRSAARLDLAKKALDAAARLRPEAGEVHLTRAVFHYWGNRDLAPALAEIAVARRLLPNDADVLFFQGAILRRAGRWAESTQHLEEAAILDPRNANLFLQLALWNYVAQKRYADAARMLDETLAWQPGDLLLELARARVDLLGRADPRRLQSVVTGDSAKSSPDIELLACARLQLALAQREYHSAREVLTAYPLSDLREAEFIMPREFYDGVVERGLGNSEGARTAFLRARERKARDVSLHAGDAKMLIVLGEIDAQLGHKSDAIRAGERALALLPPINDATDGPMIMTRLAGIYARVGEVDRALDLLRQSARMPGGAHYGSLQLEEVWDPLRGDPRFDEITASLAPDSSSR